MFRALRFLRAYLHPAGSPLATEEVRLPIGPETVEGTLYAPLGRPAEQAWVVLHGITVPGRQHPSLLRFARALAGSGGAVLVPDIPAWRELRIDPAAADATISAAARFLATRPETAGHGVGVIGFSFGATQALVTSTNPDLRDVIRSVVAFGGYCDLERSLVAMMTGVHEWQGVVRRITPDPYGRWIVAANYLTAVPAYAHMEAVQAGARELAAEAGRQGKFAADRVYDPLKAAIRARLAPDEQAVWDLFAPPADRAAPQAAARDLARFLVEAALHTHPALDPRPVLPGLHHRVVLAHGLEDRLIPFTETLRLYEEVSRHTPASATITRLFAHSTGAGGVRSHTYPVEVLRYVRLLERALRPGP